MFIDRLMDVLAKLQLASPSPTQRFWVNHMNPREDEVAVGELVPGSGVSMAGLEPGPQSQEL